MSMEQELARAQELLRKLSDLDKEVGRVRQKEGELREEFVRGLEELTGELAKLIYATGVRKERA